MTDGSLLLTAILEEPDEDTPRLIYADWLQERGGPGDQERAEFIRVQIELTHSPPRCGEPTPGGPSPWCRCAGCLLRRREADLLRRHGAAWEAEALAPLSAKLRTDSPASVRFVRGFAEALVIAPGDYMRHCAALFALNPLAAVTWAGHEPRESPSGWAWQSAGRWSADMAGQAGLLPKCVFDRLPRGARRWLDRALRFYPTRGNALAVLGVALVELGRDKAGSLALRAATDAGLPAGRGPARGA